MHAATISAGGWQHASVTNHRIDVAAGKLLNPEALAVYHNSAFGILSRAAISVDGHFQRSSCYSQCMSFINARLRFLPTNFEHLGTHQCEGVPRDHFLCDKPPFADVNGANDP